MRIAKKEKKNSFLMVYDYSKAFDKVERVRLLLALRKKMDPFVWLSLVNYYLGSYMIIYTKKTGHSQKIKISRGVKQGGSLSPLLFNFYVETLIEIIINSSLTLQILEVKMGIILYADDTVTVCNTVEQCKKVLKLIEDFCLDNEIQINVKKTFWLKNGEACRREKHTNKIIVKPSQGENFTLKGVKIEKVNNTRYLGFWLMSNGSNKLHLEKRRQVAMGALPRLNKLGFNKRELDPKVKGSLYHTFFRSKLLYALENANLSGNDIKELTTLEGKIIKHSFGLHKFCHTEPLLDLMGISSIKTLIKKRNLTFLRQLITNDLTKSLVLKNLPGNPHEKFLNDIIDFDTMPDEEKTSKIRTKILNDLNVILNDEKKRKNEQSYYKDIIEHIAPKIKSNRWHELFEYYLNSKNDMKNILGTVQPTEN